VYTVVSPAAIEDGTGLSVALGGTSFRDNQVFECSNCAREATWFFIPGTEGDMSIKMGSHGGSGDETALISLGNIPLPVGGGEWRCEGPHGNDQDLSGGSGSLGLGGTQKIGLKGISWNVGGSTEHHEIWYNADGTGNTWTKMAEFEEASNCNALACPVPEGTDDAHC
jgi:hypothetical protein